MTSLASVVLSDDASRDLNDIWQFIAQRNPYAADRIVARILHTFDLLAVTPKMGRPKHRLGRNARMVLCDRYLVIYRINDDVIEVSRIIDGRRDLTKIKLTLS